MTLTRRHFAAVAGMSLMLAKASSSAWAQTGSPSAESLLRASLQVEKAPAWTAQATLTVKSGSRVRTRVGTVFNRRAQRDNSDRLYRFAQPADIEGTAFLVRESEPADDDMWMYLPSLGKARRIVSDSKRDSFMGSDFAFADLMTLRASDFDHVALPGEDCGGTPCLVIESRPRAQRTQDAMGFARLLSYIRPGTLHTFRLRYFDAQGQEIKRQEVSDYRSVGTHWIAARREMTNLKTDRVSVLELKNIQAQNDLAAEMFTEGGLAP